MSSAAVEAWVDPSPHRARWVDHAGARIHALEWGGRGHAIVLLPGWSLTAHVFDQIAARLASAHRVVAITPRGFGESDAPRDSKYAAETLTADTKAVMDRLDVEKATVVAHSFAGATATRLARRDPRRVERLVLLDAYPRYTAAGGDEVDAREPVSPPPFTGAPSLERVREYLVRHRYGSWNDALEADLRARHVGGSAERRRALTAEYLGGDSETWEEDKVEVPVLLVSAEPTVETEYPWVDPGSAEHRRAAKYLEQIVRPFARRLRDELRARTPSVVIREVAGSHYTFFTRPAETASLIAEFAATP